MHLDYCSASCKHVFGGIKLNKTTFQNSSGIIRSKYIWIFSIQNPSTFIFKYVKIIFSLNGSNINLDFVLSKICRDAWVAQLVECLALDFGLGHELTVPGIEPYIELALLPGAFLGSLSPSLSLSLPCVLACTLSCSK